MNLFGAFRVCRAVLPIMRQQGGGCIVNIGSIGGLIAIPFQPLYSASNFALEGVTESLRLEVRPFGIRVVIIGPGDTRLRLRRTARSWKPPPTRMCTLPSRLPLKRTATYEQNGLGPEAVARLLWRVVNTPKPRLRYTVGPVAQSAAVWIKRLMPYAVLEYGMRRHYGGDSDTPYAM